MDKQFSSRFENALYRATRFRILKNIRDQQVRKSYDQSQLSHCKNKVITFEWCNRFDEKVAFCTEKKKEKSLCIHHCWPENVATSWYLQFAWCNIYKCMYFCYFRDIYSSFCIRMIAIFMQIIWLKAACAFWSPFNSFQVTLRKYSLQVEIKNCDTSNELGVHAFGGKLLVIDGKTAGKWIGRIWFFVFEKLYFCFSNLLGFKCFY